LNQIVQRESGGFFDRVMGSSMGTAGGERLLEPPSTADAALETNSR
jgi:hypothetical protein